MFFSRKNKNTQFNLIFSSSDNINNTTNTNNTNNNNKSTLRKIVNVYQLKYKNGNQEFGFGDFLRGSFCLMQFCNKNGLEFDMDLSNHPMSTYIINQPNTICNYNEILTVNKFSLYPTINDYNIYYSSHNDVYYTFNNWFPTFDIEQPEINFIKNKITPNEIMQYQIMTEMTNLNLTSKQFSVIHIRTGDNYLLNKELLNKQYVNQVFKILHPLIKNTNHKYLILSDNNQLKTLFKNFKNCIFNIKPITHLKGCNTLDDDSIKNTLLDFYLMSHSNKIYSITVYVHGSSFSKYCSIIYNIPFEIKYIIYDQNKEMHTIRNNTKDTVNMIIPKN